MATGASRPRYRAGDQVCSTHGAITPDTSGPVPVCPTCGDLALLARVSDRGDWLVVAEPAPATCDGPERHPFGPNQVLVGWTACTCAGNPAPHRGHRTWACRRCPSVIFHGSPA